ncbi:MAG TPA: SnoaL-like domain-containing protein [Chthoniobacterales bacterium]|jgi:Zn-dependent protease with chaperone function
MTTEQVAKKLVELCQRGTFEEATKTLYAQDIVSVEPRPMGDMPAEAGVSGQSAPRQNGGSRITRFTARARLGRSSQPPEFLSTHPSHGHRIQQLQGWMPEALAEYQKATQS